MKIIRRFLLPPSLARLVRKERGSTRMAEGYFAAQSGRSSHVLAEAGQCHLVLMTGGGDGPAAEERTEVPRAHAEALLDVCPGKAVYERSRVAIGGGREALVDRLTAPGLLDMVSVEFDDADEAQRFAPPAWFGPDVTADQSYDRRSIALEGMPQTSEVELSNAGLDALLDALEDRFGRQRFAPTQRRAPADTSVIDALRRLAGSEHAATAAEAPADSEPAAAASALPDEAAWPARVAPEPVAQETDEDARIDDVIASLSQALGTPGLPEAGERPSLPQEPVRPAGRMRRFGT
jgi:CYTH domain-containing protein